MFHIRLINEKIASTLPKMNLFQWIKKKCISFSFIAEMIKLKSEKSLFVNKINLTEKFLKKKIN